MDFPPNSDKSKAAPKAEKNIKQVTTGDVLRRKKPLGKQFKETFIGGDAKSTAHYVMFGVLIPAAKDALADAGSQGLEKLIFGESRSGKRRPGAPPSGPAGYINYQRISNNRPSQADDRREMSRRARATHDFDEVVLPSRTDAEDVIDAMFTLVSQYGAASVADMYELLGLKSEHTDQKWGWTDMRGASVARVRNGFLLDLPETEPLN